MSAACYLQLVRPKKLFSIVAVHGLNPTNKKGHAEETWSVNGKLWLKDFLPKRLPAARILLFGYNSSVIFRTSAVGVHEAAEDLLTRLDSFRRECPERPLLFIAYSLGGIVVKIVGDIFLIAVPMESQMLRELSTTL